MIWKIGCSGYHYDEWKGLFYPENIPKNKWFEFYANHFNTIELNTTFYRFPRVEFLRTWYQRSPNHFSFSVKAPRLITHFKKFKDAQKYLLDFYSTVKNGLNDKLGCVLFQFPANFKFQEEHLERITKLLDSSFQNVLEFRDLSWWNDNVKNALADHHISFVGMSHPSLPDDVVKTTNTLYYRFHGTPHLYTSRYDMSALEGTIQKIHQLDGVQEAYIYFNNTAEGAAISNAREFQEICELVH
jgi:uncharacterized protein YecE (DUF72 family)